MGTRFAPSYANLYMGRYEDQYILSNHPWATSIVFYKRYIDDLVFIWNHSEKEFDKFTEYLNYNEYGVTLSGEISSVQINYLDVTLSHENGKVVTKNFFKKVYSNSFLDFKSWHHKKWLQNIPYGQFCRIRQNCTICSS